MNTLPGLAKLDPADDSAIADLYELYLATQPVDHPWGPPPLLSDVAGDIRYGWDLEPSDRYLYRHGGGSSGPVIGVLSIDLPMRDNLHIVNIGVLVHPDHRRAGLGTKLYQAGVEIARASGRRLLSGWAKDTLAGNGFAQKLGFRQVYVGVHRRQDLTEVDWDATESLRAKALQAAEGYTLLRIVGPVPDDMIEAVATMVAAINDAPTDDLDVEDEVIDAARVRAYEHAQAGHGRTMYRLIAQRRSDGALAGNTVVGVSPERPEWADQHDTSVVAAHRGHRLGLLLKAEMMTWLREAEPRVRYLDTGNAESNRHMIAINEQLGYHVISRSIGWQKPL